MRVMDPRWGVGLTTRATHHPAAGDVDSSGGQGLVGSYQRGCTILVQATERIRDWHGGCTMGCGVALNFRRRIIALIEV